MKRFFAFVALAAMLVGCCCNCNEKVAEKAYDKYNSVVYELNIRQATAEGTFAAAEKYLPEIKAMGVTVPVKQATSIVDFFVILNGGFKS